MSDATDNPYSAPEIGACIGEQKSDRSIDRRNLIRWIASVAVLSVSCAALVCCYELLQHETNMLHYWNPELVLLRNVPAGVGYGSAAWLLAVGIGVPWGQQRFSQVLRAALFVTIAVFTVSAFSWLIRAYWPRETVIMALMLAPARFATLLFLYRNRGVNFTWVQLAGTTVIADAFWNGVVFLLLRPVFDVIPHTSTTRMCVVGSTLTVSWLIMIAAPFVWHCISQEAAIDQTDSPHHAPS